MAAHQQLAAFAVEPPHTGYRPHSPVPLQNKTEVNPLPLPLLVLQGNRGKGESETTSLSPAQAGKSLSVHREGLANTHSPSHNGFELNWLSL